jgi:hypothetical protein
MEGSHKSIYLTECFSIVLHFFTSKSHRVKLAIRFIVIICSSLLQYYFFNYVDAV